MAEENEKPAPKLFAGKEVSLEEAVGKPIQNTKKIPYLPKFAILVDYDRITKTIKYKEAPGFRILSMYNSGPDQVKVLTGRKGRELMDAMTDHESRIPLTSKLYPIPVDLGADPEIFVVDKKNEVVPAWKFLGDKPKYSDPGGITAYWDGFQAEFTCSHTGCIAYVLDNIRQGLLQVYNALPRDTKLSHESVLRVDPEILASAEDKHVEFGCMPSKNAYGIKGELAQGRFTPIRFAGGHIHFGYYYKKDRPKTEEHTQNIVKMLDRVIGIPSVLLFQHMDQPIRRQFYGLPGEYREPPHGLEYRTLSNAWLCHPTAACLVLEIARMGFISGWYQVNDVWKGKDDEVIDIIQRGDVKGAQAMMEANKKTWLDIISVKGPLRGTTSELVFNSLSEGIGKLIKDPTDIEGNWRLGKEWIAHSEGDDIHISRAITKWLKGKKV